jgi:ABC-type sugar transport systems, permease components
MNRRKLREAAAGYLFLLPTLLVIGTFLLAPIVYALFLSFHKGAAARRHLVPLH